jgi:hypothetical protein
MRKARQQQRGGRRKAPHQPKPDADRTKIRDRPKQKRQR